MAIEAGAPPGAARHALLLAWSPLAVVAIGHLTARLAGQAIGAAAWVPLTIVFWLTLALLIRAGGGFAAWRRWVQAARAGSSRGWPALAIVVALLPAPLLWMNWRLLAPWSLWLPWLLFALINPWFEEGYWRGVLLEATRGWPPLAALLYSSACFALSHPLIWGVNSVANRTPEVVVSTFLMGLAWGTIFRRTGSLRWCILSHVLVDLFNLSVVVFLNLYIPPHRP